MTSEHTRLRGPVWGQFGRIHFRSDWPESHATGRRDLVPIASAETEHSEQRCVYIPLLFRCETTGQTPKPPHVNRADLFDEHTSGCGIDLDLGSEGCGSGTGGCRCKQDHRAREERVGLHDHTVSLTVLFVADLFGES